MSADDANVSRWDGNRRGHYEVWYLTLNHTASRTGYWIRYTIDVPEARSGPAYAAVWFARFHRTDPEQTFGFHRRFPIDATRLTSAPFAVHIAASELTSSGCRGELAGNSHLARWQLSWPAGDSVLRFLPDVMYARGGLGETTVHSPTPRAAVQGWIEVDGQSLEVEGNIVGQTHVWGRKHAQQWAWARCAVFDDGSAGVLEALTVKLRRAGVTLPGLTLARLDLAGESFEFNQFRHTLANRGSWGTSSYELTAYSARAKLVAQFSCLPAQMLVAPYLDPDGEPSYCANTEVGDARLTLFDRRGLSWKQRLTLTSTGCAHFELGARTRDPEIHGNHLLLP
jgi:hypothetical protein